jgi:PHD/YefM family antitoxin component YafN of YafNO toxin-antitoxin module
MNAKIAETMGNLAPMSWFSQGKASLVFKMLKKSGHVVVLKNNKPEAVMISPEEFTRLAEAEEDLYLLAEAQSRMKQGWDDETISHEELLEDLGLTSDDIEKARDYALS